MPPRPAYQSRSLSEVGIEVSELRDLMHKAAPMALVTVKVQLPRVGDAPTIVRNHESHEYESDFGDLAWELGLRGA